MASTLACSTIWFARTLRLVDDLVGLGAGFAQDLVDLFFGLGEILLGAIGGFEAFGDLLLALFDGAHHQRPHELVREPDQDRESEGLPDESGVDIHAFTPR